MKVGTLGFNAEKLARQTVAAGNTDSACPHVGIHSIGPVEFEAPIFSSHSLEKFEPSMALLSIDILLFHGFRIEDRFQIDDKGAKPRFAGYQNMVPLVLS